MFKKLALLAVLMCGLSLGWINSDSALEIKEQPLFTQQSNSVGQTDLTLSAPVLVYELKPDSQVDLNMYPNNSDPSQIVNEDPGDPVIATIVIDPGHGPWVNLDMEPIAPGSDVMKRKYGVGASGNITGTRERDINLYVSLRLRDLLIQSGFNVIMTRVTNQEILSNIDRANLANDNLADLMIRVHSDSYSDTTIHGASMLVPGKVGYATEIVDASRQYGEIILDTLVAEVGMANRGIITRTDQTGFNWSKVPIITVEMGFLSNPEEDQLLSTLEYQDRLADALYLGIVKCFDSE